ncbi:hydroxyethylthiazole kinase [Clostridium sp. CAG:253]|nr:hydroxyethylthiazole kinase [Clostridium sp. CAG:253]
MIFGKKSNDLKGEKSISGGGAVSDRQLKDIVKKYIGYVKSTSPNVHCLTNVVTMQDVANMLLVAGGSAIMAQDKKEMEEITQISSATLINMGVPSDEKIAAYIVAGKTANRLGHPVVFDPVGVGASNYRKSCAEEILKNVNPDIIRCNQEEAKILLGLNSEIVSNGVESSIKLTEREQEKTAIALANKFDTIAFISGSLDTISDGNIVLKIDGGDSRMRRVSGTGCMLSALCALFAAGVYAVSEIEKKASNIEDNENSNFNEKYFYAAYSAGKVWKDTAKSTGVLADINGEGIGTYHSMLFDELEKMMEKC